MALHSLPEHLAQCAAQGLKPGVALGAFGLIHAGTIEFLRAARTECDRLFVVILPEPPALAAGKTHSLLRAEERARVLQSLVEVETVGFAGGEGNPSLETLHRAAPASIWFRSADENDVDDATAEQLTKTGAPVRTTKTTGTCTTARLLERITRGK